MREQFHAIARLLPAPLLLLSTDARIIAANPPAERLLAGAGTYREGASLLDFCAGEPEEILGYLRLCARSGDPLPGAIALRPPSSQARLRCEGARLAGAPGERFIQLRLWPSEEANSFVLLNQKIAQLNEEILWRKAVQADLEASEVRLRQLYESLSRLQVLTAGLSEARTSSEIAAIALDKGAASVGAVAGVVLLLSEDGATLGVVQQVGYSEYLEAMGLREIPLDADLPAAKAVRARSAVLVRSPEEDPERCRASKRPGAGPVNAAFAALPLVVQERPLGALCLGFAEPQAFPPDEVELMTAIARQCAQALDRARLYETEAKARAEAREANRRKDEFLAILGHELRNPLAPIVTALQLMRMRGSDAFQRERDVIERQVRHMVGLIDDLLDVSRITRGKIELKRQHGEIAPIVARAVEMASPLFEQRAHELRLDVPTRGLAVDVDPGRIAQAFANLLTNAAKYTEPRGTIVVTADREHHDVVFRVRDSGIGISPEMLPEVFELFVQEGRSLDRSQGGLGIGLNIVRRLVEMHGGNVSAHSEGLGKGSEFVVRLPALPLDGVEVEAPSSRVSHAGGPEVDPRRTGRILLVDDNTDAAEVLAEALQSLGYVTWVVHDAPAALRMAVEVEPTIAIVDIGLPVMDGYELARHLRVQRPRLLLIAVTGYGQAADRARARAAGFDEHLVKPIDLARLGQTLDRLARGAAEERTPLG